MNSLVLKPTGSHYGREWSGDDFVVMRDGEVIGRILLHPMAPPGARGSGRSRCENSRRQFIITATQLLATKRWRLQGAIVRPLVNLEHSRHSSRGPKLR